MPTAKKRPYTKRQKAYWAKKRAANGTNGKVVPPPRDVLAEAAEQLKCAFCTEKPFAAITPLHRGRTILLCRQDLKRFVNGEALL